MDGGSESVMQGTVRQSLRHKESETTGKGFERAREILDAARAIFAEGGYAALSMRGVAGRLGVTLGTVQHYYKTKDALVEAMLMHAFDNYQTAIDGIVHGMPEASKTEQFLRTMDFFIEDVKASSTQGIFFELSALAGRDPFAAEVMEKMFARARRAIRRLIRDVAPDLDEAELTLRAALIVSQLMGLTFFIGGNRPAPAELAGFEAATRRTMLDIATRPVAE